MATVRPISGSLRFQLALAVGALVGRFSGQPNLIFAVPILDRAGQVVAILCGSESLAPGSHFYLSDFARNGTNGGYHVIDYPDNVFVASSDAGRVLKLPPGRCFIPGRYWSAMPTCGSSRKPSSGC